MITDTVKVEIPHGTSIYGVVELMNEKELLQPKWFFKQFLKFYSRYTGNTIFAGKYIFSGETNNLYLIQELYEGGIKEVVTITFPEATMPNEMASALQRKAKIDSVRFMELVYSDSLLKSRNIPANSVLGYLMPDTYEFYIHQSPESAIDKMLYEFYAFWDESRIEKLNYVGLSLHEAVTLASIVEAETPLKSEAKIVSGLYLNRIRKGILLQADPTVQFAMGEKRRVLYKDLKRDHPYNTYVYPGLPPGPINNPGRKAMQAAIEPKKHNYIFMVSMGDGSGRHYFTKTLAEHNRYTNVYFKMRDSIRQANAE